MSSLKRTTDSGPLPPSFSLQATFSGPDQPRLPRRPPTHPQLQELKIRASGQRVSAAQLPDTTH